MVYLVIIASKNLQKSSVIQNISVILFLTIIAIVVCNYLYISIIKIQWFLLITNFASIYNSLNSR